MALQFGLGQADHLFRSEAGQSFTDVSDESGISTPWYCSRGASLFDFDEDDDVDVFVSVYRLQPNLLWQNNGDGTFTEVAEAGAWPDSTSAATTATTSARP